MYGLMRVKVVVVVEVWGAGPGGCVQSALLAVVGQQEIDERVTVVRLSAFAGLG